MAAMVKGACQACFASLPWPYQTHHRAVGHSIAAGKKLRQFTLSCNGVKSLTCSSPPPSSLLIRASSQKLSDVEAVSMTQDLSKLPSSPGIYAVYDKTGVLQYLGLSRRISTSLATHVRDLPELCATTKFAVIDAPEKAALVDAWKQWMEEYLAEAGRVPPGNEKGVTMWTERKQRIGKQDLRLTPGPNVKLNISLQDLIGIVVKEHKVVAFIKGSRSAPQCGFSHRVLTIFNEHGIEYESVNVLDEEHNHGVREALKVYSQWPTIPQIFAFGEFVGGADILDEMAASGKIKEVFQTSG